MRRKREKPSDPRLKIQIGIDRRVLLYIRAELERNSDVEEGGKYIGYVLPALDSRLEPLGFDRTMQAIVISDFLPSGPNATRTSVELQPDGEYQEKLFRQIEKIDADVEHVGTWHSHHCNGLQTLSSGDVKGYVRTVNNPQYRLDYFLASLATRLPQGTSDRDWLNHYLFVRDEHGYHKIDGWVKIIDWPTRFGAITKHSDDRLDEGVSSTRENKCLPESTAWYQLPEGKLTLAEDKRFFTERFSRGVTATRRGQRITLMGRLGSGVIAITYPSNGQETQITIVVRAGDALILEIKCELQSRRVALNAALLAANEFGLI